MKSSSSSSAGHGQATIPAAAKKVVQSLKEIVKKHSDEEIYAALKDCDMDPNLAVHVLMNQGIPFLFCFPFAWIWPLPPLIVSFFACKLGRFLMQDSDFHSVFFYPLFNLLYYRYS